MDLDCGLDKIGWSEGGAGTQYRPHGAEHFFPLKKGYVALDAVSRLSKMFSDLVFMILVRVMIGHFLNFPLSSTLHYWAAQQGCQCKTSLHKTTPTHLHLYDLNTYLFCWHCGWNSEGGCLGRLVGVGLVSQKRTASSGTTQLVLSRLRTSSPIFQRSLHFFVKDALELIMGDLVAMETYSPFPPEQQQRRCLLMGGDGEPTLPAGHFLWPRK